MAEFKDSKEIFTTLNVAGFMAAKALIDEKKYDEAIVILDGKKEHLGRYYFFMGWLEKKRDNHDKSFDLFVKSYEEKHYVSLENIISFLCARNKFSEARKYLADFVENYKKNKYDFLVNTPKLQNHESLFMGSIYQTYLKGLGCDDILLEFTLLLNDPMLTDLTRLFIQGCFIDEDSLNKGRKVFSDTIDKLYNGVVVDKTITPGRLRWYNQFMKPGFQMSYHGVNNKEIFTKMYQFYKHMYAEDVNYTAPHCINYKTPANRRIRIAFISMHFQNHSVAKDRRGIILGLPRDKFDVYTLFLRKPADAIGLSIWNNTTPIHLTDTDELTNPCDDDFAKFLAYARRTISRELLDIIVYCDIGMETLTYFLSMSRLAPVQCVTWGHSDTSGVETLDYFMSSDLYEDDAAKDHYSEKLIRLKNCLCTYYYPPYIFSVPQYAIKNQLGLPDDKNVYLCAQNIIKIHPMFDNFVQKILDKDPKGIFVTIDLGKCGADGEIFLKRMKKFGDRHMSVPGKTGIGWVSLLYRSDCLLDCYPFGGCNTSFDSFRIGKGIITLPGPMINGRFTLGMYRKMGIMDLVAKDMNDYVELAYKYANDKVFRDGVEDKINEKCMSIYCEQNSIDRWSDFLQNAVKLPMTPGEISA